MISDSKKSDEIDKWHYNTKEIKLAYKSKYNRKCKNQVSFIND